MKTVINNLRVPVEPGETEQQALERAMKQFKITEEKLKDYKVHFIKMPEHKLNFRDMGRL
jgi:hypothetical protein